MPTDTETLVLNMSADLKAFQSAMLKAAGEADRAAQRIEARFAKANQKITRDFENFRNSVATTFAALGVGFVVRDVTQLGDVWIRVGNKLASAGVELQNLAAVQQVVSDIALRTNSDLESTADLFSRMLRSSEDLGASMAQVAAVTELVSKALSGADQSERAGAIRQLGQGLASGRLQGDELRSILENSRPIAEAIAAEFQTSIGGLRDLGKQGALESRRVFEAIINAAPEIEAAFGRTSKTVGDAWTNMETRAARYLGTTESTSSAQRNFIGLIQETANNFDALADAVLVTAGVVGGALAGVAVAHAIRAIGGLVFEIGRVGTESQKLRALTAFLGGPLGIALGAAAVGMAYLATNTDVFTSSAQAAARASDSLYSALQIIANLEEAQSDSADAAEDNAKALGKTAEAAGELAALTQSAADALDDMSEKAAKSGEQLSITERASRALAVAERERALATIEAAIADQRSLQASIQRNRTLGQIVATIAGVQPDFGPTAEDQAAIDSANATIAQLEEGKRALEQLRAAPGGSGAAAGGAAAAAASSSKSGPTIAELERSAALTLARLRHEEARARVLEDAEETEKRTTAYVSAGLTSAAARAKAEAEVTVERQASNAEAQRSYELSQLQDRIDIARIGRNTALSEILSDELEIRRRTREIVDQLGVSEEEALRRAREFVDARREALEIDRQHQLELRDLHNALEIARTAGDDRAERAIERRLELEGRIAELKDLGVGEERARTQAQAELDDLERADIRGKFRSWFGDGVIAALEGDVGDFFRDWAAERFETALRDALDRVADAIFDAFDGVLTQVMNDGLSDLGGAVTGAIGGGANGGLTALGEEAAAAANVLKGQLAAAAVSAAVKEAASSVSKAASTAQVVSANTFLASSAKLAAAALQQLAVSGGSKSKGGILGDLIGAVFGGGSKGSGFSFGGGKAVGGPINPGVIYQVHKDELITPRVPGFVIPKNMLGGRRASVTVQDNRVFNITGASQAEVAQVRALLNQDFATRRSQIINTVQDALNRRQIQ